MAILWTVLGILLAVITLIVLLALTKPDQFNIERRTTINASPAMVFALVNDFHAWPRWSPWEHLDPAMTRTHSGAVSGVGAIYEWTGNSKVGEGRMEILSSVLNERVGIKLNFVRPFKAENTATYVIAGNEQSSEILWSMGGPMLFVSKIMSVFVSMDKMIGKDFELGLRQLKAELERTAA